MLLLYYFIISLQEMQSTGVMTPGKAGGLGKPWKGMTQTTPLKGPQMGRPTALLPHGGSLKGRPFYALVFLLPVNGSMSSFKLI